MDRSVADRPTPERRGIRRPDRSIRWKLTLFVAVLVAVTTAALSALEYAYVGRVLRDRMHERLQMQGEGLAETLVAYVKHQHERVQLVASRTTLRDVLAAPLNGTLGDEEFVERTRRILLDSLSSVGDFLQIRITDRDGRVVTATDAEAIGRDLSGDPDFVAGRESPHVGLPRRTEDGFRSTLSAPVTSHDGRPLGVAMVEIDAQSMLNALSLVLSRLDSTAVRIGTREGVGEGRIRYLFPVSDRDLATGPEVAATQVVDAARDAPMRAALAGEAGFATCEALDGRRVLAVHRPVGYRDWALVVQVDAREAYGPIVRLGWLSAAIGGMVATFAVFAAWALARRFTAPILALSRAAARLREGDLGARAGIEGRDEVAELGRGFNGMAESIERHQRELERHQVDLEERVRERTQELSLSRDRLSGVCRVLEEQADVLQRDLQRAELIQRSLLPQSPPRLPGLRVQALYRPGRSVGGDLYDVVVIDERHVALIVADASGHGVSAAMLAVLFKLRQRTVEEASGAPLRPAQALRELNASLHEVAPGPGMFVTAAYALLDTHTHEVVIASAGHPSLLWIDSAGEVRPLPRTGPALGLYRGATYDERRLTLAPEDRLLLFTDGILDLVQGSPTTPGELGAWLHAQRDEAHERPILEELYRHFSQGEPVADPDDVTLLLLEVTPGASRFDDASPIDLPAHRSDDDRFELTYASTEGANFLRLVGRGAWTDATAFFDAAESMLRTERPLVLDLTGCEHLDSTFLGTIHEVVVRADAAGVPVELQGLGRVAALFDELHMTLVLAHVRESAHPLPDSLLSVPSASPDRRLARQMRLLRAHEMLASLDEHNRDQFAAVVDALRDELGRG